jgi:Ni,Fe-hydrogenase III large subunit
MAILEDFISQGTAVAGHRPWPRFIAGEKLWNAIAETLADGRLTLLGLWGEEASVHMALLDEAAADIAVASLPCADGAFASIARRHAPAQRLERTITDLWGLKPRGAPDRRAWLDHGWWGVRAPLGRASRTAVKAADYAFLESDGESLHQIPVGPVHAGIIEPGHFRFTANGETLVRLEERLGYVHKGIEGLMRGADLDRGAALAARLSGDSMAACGLAFARAVEAALDTQAPERAQWLRALMAETERLANHLGDIGAICNDASFSLMHTHCGVLREQVLRAADAAFGHRLMRERIVPGGVAADVDEQGTVALRAMVDEVRRRFPALVELYDNTASLLDRTVSTGAVSPELVRRFGAGGFVGRASGRAFDARRAPGYPPYDRLDFEVPVREAGDVDARVWIRILEIDQSLSLVEQILDGAPRGALRAALPAAPEACEGMALVEGFRGDILAWVRIGGDDRIERCHLRDPSWFQWPLLEAAVYGNIVADFPLCNKSFNCSYSGHDL